MIATGLTHLRTKPMLRIYSGYDPLNPKSPRSMYPVKAEEVSTIKEGMVMFPKYNSGTTRVEWTLTAPTGTSSPEPHIALTDADRSDVVTADSLVGLPCSASFELHTPWYDQDVNSQGFATSNALYAQGCPLTYKDGTGKLTPTTATGQAVVAVVTRRLPFDVSAEDSSFDKSVAANCLVLKVRTCYNPLSIDAN